MGLFNNNGSTAAAAAAAPRSQMDSGTSRSRRRSIDGGKNIRGNLDSSDDEAMMAGGHKPSRRNSNSGMNRGAEAGRGGYPAIEGYTVLERIGEGAFSKV
ncbi:hypothetical protein EV175_007512, partial [Coemansia sp. RSA 1933]